MKNEEDQLSYDSKCPITYEQQIDKIVQKGFIVSDRSQCIMFLKKVNYYRLTAYFLPFKRNDSTYFPNINFSRIQQIYDFDSEMRSLLFRLIEDIELFIRAQLAYYSGHKYGALGYLEASNFSQKHNKEQFEKHLNNCINENRQTLVVKHHNDKYGGNFPIWVIIEFFSMGMLSYYYSDLKTEDQKFLAKNMYGTSVACLKSWLHCLTNLRNRCAHYSRLYYWRFPALPKLPKGENFEADRRLFTQLLVIKYLYPDHQKWNEIILMDLVRLVEKYRPQISLKHIGFPENWQNMLEY